VIGGGAWGTALSIHLGRIGHDVRLWIREAEVVGRMIERRDNPAYLPGVRVPDTVHPVAEIARALERADVVIGSVPAQFARGTFREIAPQLVSGTAVVVTTKGIEEKTLALPLEVAAAELGDAAPLAILSGPSFASEVAGGLPTAVVVASSSRKLANRLQQVLSSRELRIYTNGDPIGVQLAAALKNVMAIAVGIADSLGLGTNARAGLITRGLAEIRRLIMARGGEEVTASGLAGLGDLVLTCTGDLSRNRRVGRRLGRGERLLDILEGSRAVAEGVRTARSARDLARRHGVEMPIVEGVYRILYEDESPEEGLDRLLSRPLTSEDDPARNPGKR
jgi:glycerol-3-phosphate dehydrogenase (NAD(P)+)